MVGARRTDQRVAVVYSTCVVATCLRRALLDRPSGQHVVLVCCLGVGIVGGGGGGDGFAEVGAFDAGDAWVAGFVVGVQVEGVEPGLVEAASGAGFTVGVGMGDGPGVVESFCEVFSGVQFDLVERCELVFEYAELAG